jgi:hypothetical protein
MKAKHTPGPWDNGLDANGRPLIFQQRPDEFMLPHEINEEWQANRALVDAAPDLLAVLTWFQDQLADDSAIDMGRMLDEMERRARHATAKATGGAA